MVLILIPDQHPLFDDASIRHSLNSSAAMLKGRINFPLMPMPSQWTNIWPWQRSKLKDYVAQKVAQEKRLVDDHMLVNVLVAKLILVEILLVRVVVHILVHVMLLVLARVLEVV